MSPYAFAPYLYLPLPFLYLLVAAVLLWRKPVLQRRLLVLTTALFLLFSTPAFSRLMILALVPDAGQSSQWRRQAVAVVVPTAGIYQASGGKWWADIESLSRFEAGHKLATARGIPLIVSGGRTRQGGPSEASVVFEQTKPVGGEIVLEEVSRNTFATGRNVKVLLQEMGPGPVIIVTSPSHCLCTAAVFRNVGIQAVPVPSGEFSWIDNRTTVTEWRDFLPSVRGLSYANRASSEFAAILWYLANGRFSPEDLFASM